MKILLNLLPLKTGGGVQVALDFLENIAQYGKQHEWLVICRAGMPFEQYCKRHIKLVARVADNLPSRAKFEWLGYAQISKTLQPEVALTLFGPHLRIQGAVNIGGCAYSNLFYPEIDFWQGLPSHRKLIKKVIDQLRFKRLAHNDITIFETEDLAKRAKKILQPKQKVTFIRPACSSLVNKDRSHTATQSKCQKIPKAFTITLISGYHPNKNIEFLASVARELKRMGEIGICFVLTLPPSNPKVQEFFTGVKNANLGAYFYNLGPVPQAGCAEVYRACDAAILPSNLESFSNMIAESWAMQKPLLISDQSWSRSICADGAIYYPHLKPAELARKIVALKSGEINVQACIARGLNQLNQYPTSHDRFVQYLQLIEQTASSDIESTLPEHPPQSQTQAHP